MPLNPISPHKILCRLEADPNYPSFEHLKMMMNQVAHLPELMGERIHDIVTVRGFVTTQADMMAAALKHGFHDPTKEYRRELERLVGICRSLVAEYGDRLDKGLHNDIGSGLNAEAAAQFNDGTLTYAVLLDLDPAVLMPRLKP